jgi:galactonate dehydratase
MAVYKPSWVEEPVPPDNMDELARAYDLIAGAVPVAAGERCYTRYGARDLLEHGKIDIAQFDVTHCGGILELKKMAAMADARYVTVAPHNSSGPVCTAASVHAGFTMTNLKCQEVFDDFAEPHVRDAVVGFPRVVDGYIHPPEKPGLGVELDEAVIRANPVRKVFFNLWDSDWHMREASMASRAGPAGQGLALPIPRAGKARLGTARRRGRRSHGRA